MVNLTKNISVILALDVTERDKAFEILDDTYDLLDAIKVGYPLLFSCGIDICRGMKKNIEYL